MRIRFGHIPKCAGTKIKESFRIIKGFRRYTHAMRVCEQKGYRFTSVRHPLDWYVSLWAYKISGTKYTFEDKDFETLLRDHLVDVHRRKRWWLPRGKWFDEFLEFTNVDIGILSMFFIRQAFVDWKEILNTKDPIEETLSRKKFDLERVVKVENFKDDLLSVLDDISYKKKIDLDSRINKTEHKHYICYYTPYLKDLVLNKERLIIKLFYKDHKRCQMES